MPSFFHGVDQRFTFPRDRTVNYRLSTVDSDELPEPGLRPHYRRSHGRQHLLALKVAGFRALAGDHGLSLLFAGSLVHVEELVEQVGSDVFRLLVDGTRVFRRTDSAVRPARYADFLMELVADGPAKALQKPQSS